MTVTEKQAQHTRAIVAEVHAERVRHRSAHNWTIAHDDEHSDRSLSKAAAAYALSASGLMKNGPTLHPWPWDKKWWNPKDPRRDLIRAAALIVAEIERLDRLSPSAEGHQK